MTRRKGLLVAGGILLACLILATLMMQLRPAPEARPLPDGTPAVLTAPAALGVGPIPVHGAGTVRPVAEVHVTPEVHGKVSWVNPVFQSGGRVREGQALFRIEDADYRNRVRQARASVAAGQVALMQAQEEARIARSEYAQFQRREGDAAAPEEANALVLREPQLRAAEAALARDSTILADAELALSRTEVLAPFHGIVLEESVDPGQFVAAGQGVGRLYASDAVEVVVPLSDADAALIPDLWRLQAGDGNARVAARVLAEYGDGRYAWSGYVDRAEASLDEQTRTIDVIVRVSNPLAGGARADAPNDAADYSTAPPLLVGKFVEVQIEGVVPDEYFMVRRSGLRPGNEVWAVRDDTLLTLLPVRVLQRTDDEVFVVGGLEAGQEVVVGGISFATEGMIVRTASRANP